MQSFNKLSISARIAANNRSMTQIPKPVNQITRKAPKPRRIVASTARSIPPRVEAIVETPIEVMDGPVLGPGAVNTHFFDGKIHYAMERIAPFIEAASKVSAVVKLREFQQFKRRLTVQAAIRSYTIIVRDFEGAGRTVVSGNWDSTNRLYACDLLYAIVMNSSKSDELVSLLEAQLVDMQTGMCPQGRTTRLVQCLWSLLT